MIEVKIVFLDENGNTLTTRTFEMDRVPVEKEKIEIELRFGIVKNVEWVIPDGRNDNLRRVPIVYCVIQ